MRWLGGAVESESLTRHVWAELGGWSSPMVVEAGGWTWGNTNASKKNTYYTHVGQVFLSEKKIQSKTCFKVDCVTYSEALLNDIDRKIAHC